MGGFLVAAMTLTGQLSGHALLLTCTGLFVVGAVLGFTHGAVLGWLGRPVAETRQAALGGLAMGAVYAVPALLLSWLVAGWIAMTSVAIYADRLAALIGCVVAWLVGMAVVGGAAKKGWEALVVAYRGWSDARVGTLLVAALFGGLVAVFLAERPMLWGLPLRVTPVGAVLLAAAATLWLAGPLVTVALAALDRLPARPALGFGGRGRAVASVAMAMVIGVILALMALPFYQAAYGVAAGGLAAGLTTALLDEVLLRLFLVTAVVWLLLRELELRPGRAAFVAVAIAAGVQVLVYLPGVLAIGFPSLAAATAFVVVTVLVPALAFGALYWRRGFGAAVVAHATALAALFLISG